MKILIISENQHNKIGGIENYNTQLIKIFHNAGHSIDEYSFNIDPLNKSVVKESKNVKLLNPIPLNAKQLSIMQKQKAFKLGVKEIIKICNNYDVVINSASNVAWPKSIHQNKKWIYVQHYNKDFYRQKFICGSLLRPIIYFGMWLVGLKNPFKNFQNFVVFSDCDKQELKIRPGSYIFPIALSSYTYDEILKMKNDYNNRIQKNNYDYMYIGRYDNFQKNITKMCDYFIRNKMTINLYGSGNSKLIPQSEYCINNGYVAKNIVSSTICKYSFLVLLSKYEGLPFVVTEALSCGVPVISTHNSSSTPMLLENKGFIVDSKNIDEKLQWINAMSHDQYMQLVNNCFDFSLKNLTLEIFEKKWLDVIQEIQSKNQHSY